MSQSKRHSLIEVVLNICTGLVLAFSISQLAYAFQDEIRLYIWEGFTWTISTESNIVMTIVLTVVSLIRSYIWRRIFNNIQLKNYQYIDRELKEKVDSLVEGVEIDLDKPLRGDDDVSN